MKNITLFLLLTITLTACSNKKEQNISLFNEVTFRINDNERVMDIDSHHVTAFKSFFNDSSIQIPLFKFIKSDSYLIFIALPFNTSIKKLANNNKLKDTLREVSYETDTNSFFYKKYERKNEFITVYTKDFNNNLVYVLTSSNNSVLSDSLFNMETILERFNK